ncbi:MAG: hypothetical protein ACKPE3_11605, partial [Sphaerospermopsis kisseleviana]
LAINPDVPELELQDDEESIKLKKKLKDKFLKILNHRNKMLKSKIIKQQIRNFKKWTNTR